MLNNRNKNQKKRILCYFILSLFITMFWGQGVWYYKQLTSQYETVGVRFNGMGVSLGELNRALENEKTMGSERIPEPTAYNVLGSQSVKETFFNREVSVTLMMVYGNMKQVLPMKLILGNYPFTEDTIGCVIDKMSAFTLFGSIDVVGKSITINNKEYYIRGVVDNTIPVVLYQTNSESEKFRQLELDFFGAENGRMYAEDFIRNHLYYYNNNTTIVEGIYVARLMGNIVVIPSLLLLVISLIRRITRHKKSVYTLIYTIGNVSLMVYLMRNLMYVPKRFIPTRWSNLSHWSSIIKDIKQHYMDLNTISPIRKDIVLKELSVACLVSIIIASLLLVLLFVYKNMYTKVEMEERCNEVIRIRIQEKESQEDHIQERKLQDIKENIDEKALLWSLLVFLLGCMLGIYLLFLQHEEILYFAGFPMVYLLIIFCNYIEGILQNGRNVKNSYGKKYKIKLHL